MTFCTGCGANLEADSQFCTNCGIAVEAPVPTEHLPAHVAPQAATKNGRLARAFAAAIAVLMVAVMLQGWLNIHMDMTPWGSNWSMIQSVMWDFSRQLGFRQTDVMGLFSQNTSFTMSVHELSNMAGMLSWYVDLMEPIASVMDPIEYLEFRAMADNINSFAVAIAVVRILQASGILLLAIFLFLLLLEAKFAGQAGQLATLVIFLTAAFFAAATAVINFILPFPANVFGGNIPDLGLWVDIGLTASPWVWATMAISAACFLLITLRKSAFKGGN